MKITKRIISAFLAVLLLISAVSCAKSGDGESTSNTLPATEEVTTPAPPTEIILVDEEKNDYTIIRADKAETYEVEAARVLNLSLIEKFGSVWDIKIKNDFEKGLKDGESVKNENREILIGYTNREESRVVFDSLKEDEYAIKAVGNKIVVIGKNQYATLQAMNEFVEKYVKSTDGKILSVPIDFSISGFASLRKVPIHNNADYRIMTYNLGCDVGVADDALDVILTFLPDIICLQEANKAVHTKVVSKMPSEYKVAIEFHSNGKTYNYTPIVYNSKLFTLKESGLEWLRGRYTGTNTKSLSWAVFSDNDGKNFAVINFHGAVCSASYTGFENKTAEEREAQAKAWRLDNVKQILEAKAKIEAKHPGISFMITGDCNFNSLSEPYKNLTDAGFYEAEKSASDGKIGGIKTSFSYGSISSPVSGNSIDHIFGINKISFVLHDIVREGKVYTASDHLAVYTDFKIAE